MAVDPSIAAQAEGTAHRSEEAFSQAAPPLRDRELLTASLADFVARHSDGK
jgi:hypothetical protein